MGKKQNQHQRTKGNLQASSSSRAAQLLQHKNGNISNTTLGFTKDGVISNVDPVISAAFRKLCKKEPVTKQKALIEIIDAVAEDNIEGCLTLWSRHYHKIAIDTDKKIRELSQQLHGKIVATAGRTLAPQLSSLIGQWLESTCDLHTATSHIASAALVSTFPGIKLNNALTFCETGISKHLRDRLTSTPASLSDMKITDPVDASEKYTRVIGSTLRLITSLVSRETKLRAVESLISDTAVWGLCRSKHPQVRKHVYNFISDLSQVSGLALPDAAFKAATQNLNNCSPDTTGSQLAALLLLLQNYSDKFYSTISISDVRGQLLDVIKAKALNSGVVHIALPKLAGIVPILYNKWIGEDLHGQWYLDVLANSSKCLQQSKANSDKLAVLNFVAKISDAIDNEHGHKIPSAAPVDSMIRTLTSTALREDWLEPLQAILSHLPDRARLASRGAGEICQDPASALLAIQQNSYETSNTTSLLGVLERLGVPDTSIVPGLVERCCARMGSRDYEYVRRVVSCRPSLRAPFFTKLAECDTMTSLSLTNLTKSLLLSLFADREVSAAQTRELCAIVVGWVVLCEGGAGSLVKTLVSQAHHVIPAFHAFLEAQIAQPTCELLSDDMVIEFVGCQGDVPQELLSDLITLSESRRDLEEWLIGLVAALSAARTFTSNLDTLLRQLPWSDDRASHVQAIGTLLEALDADSILQLSAGLANIVQLTTTHLPRLADIILRSVPGLGEPAAATLSQIYQASPQHLVMGCVARLPDLTGSRGALVGLYERCGVMMRDGRCSDHLIWSSGEHVVYSVVTEFVGGVLGKLSQQGDDVIRALSKLVVYKYAGNIESSCPLTAQLAMHEDLCHRVMDVLLSHHDVFLMPLLTDLQHQGLSVDYTRLGSLALLTNEYLAKLILSQRNPDHYLELLKKQREGSSGMSPLDKLLFLHLDLTNTNTIPDVIEFVTTDILYSDHLDYNTITLIFDIFLKIFQSSTLLEDVEFVLCSTATLVQSTLDLVKCDMGGLAQYHLTCALISFKQLYTTLQADITSDEKHSQLVEDWTLYFEPGIQDLLLLLHSKLLSVPLSSTLSSTLAHLSPLICRAPVQSVRGFMKQPLKKSEGVSFNDCFERVMEQYESSLQYETQTALFFLLLHSQNLFEMKPEVKVPDENEETAVFESPPKIFLGALSAVDLVNFETRDVYEYRLVKAAQIWVLLLIYESQQSSDVLREHVAFLRSKQILSDFLDNLVYLIKFSPKRYEILPLDSILECGVLECHQLASTCFMGIARVFPALLRSWWKGLDKELSISVEQYVTCFVAPTLIKLETDIGSNPEDGTLIIKPRPVVKEVVATYKMDDDITADLIIKISSNHPLSPPTVSCEQQIGVPVGTWRSWMLQMTSMFQNQNSSIVEALQHWRDNMDRQFEGLDSCMICFSVVQGPKKALPKPCCKTCKQKFHSACLYKWFSTSGKSSCPMCRATFQHYSGLRARLQEEQHQQ